MRSTNLILFVCVYIQSVRRFTMTLQSVPDLQLKKFCTYSTVPLILYQDLKTLSFDEGIDFTCDVASGSEKVTERMLNGNCENVTRSE